MLVSLKQVISASNAVIEFPEIEDLILQPGSQSSPQELDLSGRQEEVPLHLLPSGHTWWDVRRSRDTFQGNTDEHICLQGQGTKSVSRSVNHVLKLNPGETESLWSGEVGRILYCKACVLCSFISEEQRNASWKISLTREISAQAFAAAPTPTTKQTMCQGSHCFSAGPSHPAPDSDILWAKSPPREVSPFSSLAVHSSPSLG